MDRVMADSVDSFAIVKDSIEGILERLRMSGGSGSGSPNERKPRTETETCRHASARAKYRAREVLMGKGQLKVGAYINSGLLTIHVMEARKLECSKAEGCNSYVKVEMKSFSDRSLRQICRTTVVRRTNSPRYDQKFSFELSSMHEGNRVLISVWHRDAAKRNCEFLGCMSFGIAHIIKREVCGWYRILTEKLGRTKHFAAAP